MVVRGRRGPRRGPVVVVGRRRPPVGAAVAGAAIVGGAVAISAAERRRREEEAARLRAIEREREAEIRAREAEAALVASAAANQMAAANQQAAANAAAASGTQLVQLQVPAGVSAGMQFEVDFGGQRHFITCPAGVASGQTIQVSLPKAAPTVSAVAAAPAPAPVAAPSAPPAYNPGLASRSDSAELGKQLLGMSLTPTQYVLTRDHIVNEADPRMAKHRIISCPVGAVVRLVNGDLVNGLGGAYKDYVEVEYNGKTGKVSRKVLEEYVDMPPPAIGEIDDVPPAL